MAQNVCVCVCYEEPVSSPPHRCLIMSRILRKRLQRHALPAEYFRTPVNLPLGQVTLQRTHQVRVRRPRKLTAHGVPLALASHLLQHPEDGVLGSAQPGHRLVHHRCQSLSDRRVPMRYAGTPRTVRRARRGACRWPAHGKTAFAVARNRGQPRGEVSAAAWPRRPACACRADRAFVCPSRRGVRGAAEVLRRVRVHRERRPRHVWWRGGHQERRSGRGCGRKQSGRRVGGHGVRRRRGVAVAHTSPRPTRRSDLRRFGPSPQRRRVVRELRRPRHARRRRLRRRRACRRCRQLPRRNPGGGAATGAAQRDACGGLVPVRGRRRVRNGCPARRRVRDGLDHLRRRRTQQVAEEGVLVRLPKGIPAAAAAAPAAAAARLRGVARLRGGLVGQEVVDVFAGEDLAALLPLLHGKVAVQVGDEVASEALRVASLHAVPLLGTLHLQQRVHDSRLVVGAHGLVQLFCRPFHVVHLSVSPAAARVAACKRVRPATGLRPGGQRGTPSLAVWVCGGTRACERRRVAGVLVPPCGGRGGRVLVAAADDGGHVPEQPGLRLDAVVSGHLPAGAHGEVRQLHLRLLAEAGRVADLHGVRGHGVQVLQEHHRVRGRVRPLPRRNVEQQVGLARVRLDAQQHHDAALLSLPRPLEHNLLQRVVGDGTLHAGGAFRAHCREALRHQEATVLAAVAGAVLLHIDVAVRQRALGARHHEERGQRGTWVVDARLQAGTVLRLVMLLVVQQLVVGLRVLRRRLRRRGV
eukprot:Rhum_TRINITY_DN10896_c0_g1::Rhum_TRINITY_DN10896_c0_g1_i1::g.40467::m.40467